MSSVLSARIQGFDFLLRIKVPFVPEPTIVSAEAASKPIATFSPPGVPDSVTIESPAFVDES